MAYLEGAPSDADATRVAGLVSRLQSRHRPEIVPRFVDELVGEDRTVGLLVDIPSPGEDASFERATLVEVVRLVEAVEDFTRTTGDVFAWELDGAIVGWIEVGSRDSLLEDGFLAPWRQRLGRLQG